MGKMGIALQLYTVRDPAAKDLEGTLKRCRETGFEYVQWSGLPAGTAEQVRNVLDAAELKAIAAHIGTEDFEKDYAKHVRYWQHVGVPDLAVGGMMPDCHSALDRWLAGSARLDALGKRLRADGLRLSYHNHAFEFERFSGEARCKLDVLMDATGPAHLYAELDTAWVHVGGADPAAYIRKYARRCPVIHVKDLVETKDGQPKFTPLGQGVLDWGGILKAAEEAHVEWLVYEQDTCDGDPLDSVAASYKFLAKRT